MFQNINENTVNTARYEEDNSHKKKIEIFSNVLSIKNIIIYIIAKEVCNSCYKLPYFTKFFPAFLYPKYVSDSVWSL